MNASFFPTLCHVCVLCGVVSLPALFPVEASAETYDLSEPDNDSRVYDVQQTMSVSGTLKAPRPDDEPVSLKMTAEAKHAFLERRLSGRGRDAKAYRVLRHYQTVRMDVTVGREKQRKRFSEDARRLVMQGDDTGLTSYSPDGPLWYSDLESLHMPGDSLAAQTLLPSRKVSVGDEWTPESWTVQLLTDIDAAVKTEIRCRLQSVSNQQAVIKFFGQTEGARDSAPTVIKFSGTYTFDLKHSHIAALSLKQTEKSEAGPVSPAFDVTAEVSLQRQLADQPGELTDRAVRGIPLNPKPEQLRVRFSPSADATFLIDRDWHVVYHRAEMSILRLIDDGLLLGQVNIKPLERAEPGKHVPHDEFVADIRRNLGPRLNRIVKSERIRPKAPGPRPKAPGPRPKAPGPRPGGQPDDRYFFRVTAEGKANGIDVRWTYYLCAAPDGRQISLLFAVEKKLLKKFGDRDLGFVLGVRFPQERSR